MDTKQIQRERISIFNNVYEGKIPKRVPIDIAQEIDVIAERYNINVIDARWDASIVEEAADKFCQEFYSDVCPYKGALRWPAFYQLLGSQSYVMSSTGFMQHPEVHCMFSEDYDEFIENPYDCIVEKLIPRQYKTLSPDHFMRTAMNLVKSVWAMEDDFMKAGATIGRLTEKFGYYKGEPGVNGGTPAPFDFIADELRGFSGISIDIRRNPQKVIDACEAIYPMVLKTGMPDAISKYGHVAMMLHMPTFMKESDFAKFYWPTFKRLLDDYASMGIHAYIFCEDDWERYIPYLQDLPVNTLIHFEYGDQKLFKEKIGSRHILMSNYPLMYLRSHTKQECIDKAKELIDIMAPGGRCVFNFDKGALSIKDLNMENAKAVTEFVCDYAVYDNVGAASGDVFNKEDYKKTPSKEFSSKYWQTLDDQYKSNANVTDYAAKRLQAYENRICMFLKRLVS